MRHCSAGAWPPDDVPAWMWDVLDSYFDWRRFQVLPYPGGVAQQPARVMAVYRILDTLYSEIVDSMKASEEWHRSKGKVK